MNSSGTQIFSTLLVVTLLLLLVFAGLRWIALPVGDFLDWVIGIAGFWWLTLITTVPWNMHFKAREVLADIQNYKEKNEAISAADVSYARKIARNYLIVAIALHLLSALGLYLLSYYKITPLGYWGAAFALLLTGLRPAVRLVEYIHYRLNAISMDIRYPKQDVHKLIDDVNILKNEVATLNETLQNDNPNSWLSQKNAQMERMEKTIYAMEKQIYNYRMEQEKSFEQMRSQMEQKIAQLSEDAKFLSQVRDLIRFIKNA